MTTETELCKLAIKWHTDKCPSIAHSYTPYYNGLFRKKEVRKLLEIGIGYPETMSHVPNYTTGASLRMWEEYFPQAEIFGVDIKTETMVNEGRIRSFLCDQGNEDQLRRLAATVGGGFDVVIDDGSHMPEHQTLSANTLVPLLLGPKGVYIIEDVGYPERVSAGLLYKHEVVDFNTEVAWDRIITIGEGGKPLMKENRNLGRIVGPYTMLSPERIELLIDLSRRAEAENIPGDMVECGVWNGGSAAVLAHFASISKFNRKAWLFDSFEGMPVTTPEDGMSLDGCHAAQDFIHKCVGSLDKVHEVLDLTGADRSRVIIKKGWFHETFLSVEIPQIALLSIDSDWYESEKLCLEKFYDCVTDGGFIYLDNFYYWTGCQKAVLEFLSHRGKIPTLNQVGISAWLQKPING